MESRAALAADETAAARLRSEVALLKQARRDGRWPEAAVLPALARAFQSAGLLCLLYRTRMLGTLESLLPLLGGGGGGGLPLESARWCASCIVSGLSRLHSHRILHRDLSLTRLGVSEAGYVVLVSCRYAKLLGTEDERTWTLCGSPEYASPSMVKHGGHGLPADCWGLGVLLYRLLLGAYPFGSTADAGGELKVFGRITEFERGGLAEAMGEADGCDEASAALLDALLDPDASTRLGGNLARDEDLGSHPWFAGVEWASISAGTAPSPLLAELGARVEELVAAGEEGGSRGGNHNPEAARLRDLLDVPLPEGATDEGFDDFGGGKSW